MKDAREFGARRVVIIDDDSEQLFSMGKIVKMLGYEVNLFEDPGKALVEMVQADQEVPYLILSDIMMPDYDGLDVFKSIRANPKFDGVPFYFLTAASQEIFSDFLKNKKYDGIIAKPVDPSSLYRILTAQKIYSDMNDTITWGLQNENGDLDAMALDQSSKQTNFEMMRRHPRIQANVPIFLQTREDGKEARIYEISAGGMGIKVRKGNYNVGDQLKIHCRGNGLIPQFNSLAEVVFILKRTVNQNENDGDIICGLKFLSISQTVSEKIDRVVKDEIRKSMSSP